MSAKHDHRPDSPDDEGRFAYWSAARRPLQILVFLVPLIIAYELCLALLLSAEDGRSVHTVLAHKGLLQFFGALGVADAGGLYFGGLVIVVVLLIWHVLAREPWRIEFGVTGLMAIEALFLTVPLLALSHLVSSGSVAATPSGALGFAEFDIWSQMAISVGAGLYEELIFRMILIAVVHTLLVDLAGLRHVTGATIAIIISALAFTFYHDLNGPDGTFSPGRALFYLVAGLYFGGVYTLRGFGLVVGVHAIYDIITVLGTNGPLNGAAP